MRTRDYIIIFLCLIVAASLLFVAQDRLDYINAARKDMKLISNEPFENAPPSLAFASVAMGAFRGLLVDVLWMRADKLKEQGQFFDAKQLADWITTLQPRLAEVWDFQGWNMAYNISVAMPATQPAERWRWVKNGYELLRDQAIVKNPKSIILYQRLAWIFQHKMGGVSDDCHKYYRIQLALSMRPLLGDPETNETFARLAAAPKDWSAVVADPAVDKFVTAMAQADPNFAKPGRPFVENYLALRQVPQRFPAAFNIINRFRDTPELVKFDYFAKADELRTTWKLQPELMLDLNRQYGPRDIEDPNRSLPLNWEHPDVHAMYWGALGIKVAGTRGEYSADEINNDRIMFHSLQDLFKTGKMIIYDIPLMPDANDFPAGTDMSKVPPTVAKTIFNFPDLRMFEPTDRTWLFFIEKYRRMKDDTSSLENGHRNMLTSAVQNFYQAGHQAYAQRIYNELRKLYPRPDFNVPMIEFIYGQMKKDLAGVTIHDATQIITNMLRESYFRYALRDDDMAFGLEKMAREVYEKYQSEWATETVKRVDMPEFSMLRYIALNEFLNDDMYPPNMRMALLERIKIERPDVYKQLEAIAKDLMEKAKQQEQKQPAAQP